MFRKLNILSLPQVRKLGTHKNFPIYGTHTRTHTNTHTHTHMHKHTNTDTHTYTHIHVHTETHTHTWPHLLALGREEAWKMALLEVVRLSRRFLQSATGISSPLLELLASTWTGNRVKSSASTSTKTAP